jgi:hypothetical protein
MAWYFLKHGDSFTFTLPPNTKFNLNPFASSRNETVSLHSEMEQIN